MQYRFDNFFGGMVLPWMSYIHDISHHIKRKDKIDHTPDAVHAMANRRKT